MAIWNFKPQSFLSSLFVKPFNSFISFFTGFVKNKQITKKEEKPAESKSFASNSEMKIISAFPQKPKNPSLIEQVNFLEKEVVDLKQQITFLKAELALREKRRTYERAAAAPKEERSFVARMFSR